MNTQAELTLLWYMLSPQEIIAGTFVIFLAGKKIHDNRRQRKKFSDLETNKKQLEEQLMVAMMLIRTDIKDRIGFSGALRDNLGGLLSGIKNSLSMIKHNMIVTAENKLSFARSLDMLDHAIHELRRVAQHLMPESLLNFGLDAALNDLCDSINGMKSVAVSFQHVGAPRRFEPAREITVYQIVQALMNNVLQHAQATHAIVQISYEAAAIAITVEDNGKGFDHQPSGEKANTGFSDVRTKTSYLNGTFDLISTAGEGTSVHIRLPL